MKRKVKLTHPQKMYIASVSWDNFNQPNICILRIFHGEENEEGQHNTGRNNFQTFPNLTKTMFIIQKVQWILSIRNINKTKPAYIIIKLFKPSGKEKVLKDAKGGNKRERER